MIHIPRSWLPALRSYNFPLRVNRERLEISHAPLFCARAAPHSFSSLSSKVRWRTWFLDQTTCIHVLQLKQGVKGRSFSSFLYRELQGVFFVPDAWWCDSKRRLSSRIRKGFGGPSEEVSLLKSLVIMDLWISPRFIFALYILLFIFEIVSQTLLGVDHSKST